MKIVHLIFSFNIGGAQTMLVDIMNQQTKTETVNLIVINKFYHKPLIEKIDKRINIFLLNRREHSKNLLPILRLNLILFNISPDVIHCHNDNIIKLILPAYRNKTVLTLHCLGISTKFLNKYRRVFAISNSVKREMASRTEIEIITVHNGIQTSAIKQRTNYLRYPIFRILCVGRLNHKIKGQHIAIEAISRLASMGIKNVYLDLIGDGESMKFLRDMVSDFGISEQVNFLGNKERDYIYEHLRDYDLLVQPSLFEGFGLTIAEAIAAKIPVLVSDSDGPMEVIANGELGFCFRTGDPENMANQLKNIILDCPISEINEKIEIAYKHVVDELDISLTVEKYFSNFK